VAQGVWGCTLAALRCGFLYPLVLLMGLGYRIALLSSILSSVYIPAFATEVRGGWEAPLAALFLMGTVYLAVRLISSRQLRFPDALGYGCWVGVSALLSATLLLVVGGFIAAGAWVFRRSVLRYLLWNGILLTVVILCLTPWALRNRSQLGQAVWLRSNLGFELWQAYHDGAGFGALDTDARIGPALDPESSNQVRSFGELAYHEMMRRKALEWVRSHPRESAERTIVHAMYFWFPPATVFLLRVARGLLTALAVCGMVLLLARRAPGGYVIAVIWVSFPLIYYVVYWSSRYRYPMEWTLVVAAAVALSAASDRFGKAAPSRPSVLNAMR